MNFTAPRRAVPCRAAPRRAAQLNKFRAAYLLGGKFTALPTAYPHLSLSSRSKRN